MGVLDDNGTNLRRCQGITAAGKRCEKVVGPSQTHCFSHDPDKASERSALASRAAKSKHSTPCGEILEVRAKLRSIADGVLERRIPQALGSVASQVLGVYLKTFEQERKQREFDDLERRLEAVEKMYSRKGDPTDSDGYSFGSGRWAR